jgi:serine/threonine-protein kinase
MIAVLDLDRRQSSTLVRGGGHAQFVEPGHLVYGSAGTLRAVPFDPGRMAVTGDAVPVVDQVRTLATAAALFAVSQQGTLVYVPGGAEGTGARPVVWVDRQGREEAIHDLPPRAYVYARLSPDETRLALDVRDQEDDVWIWTEELKARVPAK